MPDPLYTPSYLHPLHTTRVPDPISVRPLLGRLCPSRRALRVCLVSCLDLPNIMIIIIISRNTNFNAAHCTFGATVLDVEVIFFRGWVARPFLRSRGMMSVALVRLMSFLHTGHCERLGSPGPERFSPAMRASMRQVWQKRWPVHD
jgi:hypothetical protein